MSLPELPKPTWGNVSAYSNEFGLFSVGGQSDGYQVFNLRKPNAGKLEWNKLQHDMEYEHYYPSVCIMDDNKLLVACGYNDKSVKNESASTKIEMCDLQTGKWIEWKE